MLRGLRRIFVTSAAAGLAFAMATPSQAALVVTANDYSPDAVYGGFHITGIVENTGYAGRFLSTVQDTTDFSTFDVFSFCTDVTVGYGTSYTYTLQGALGITGNAAKQAQLAGLLAHANAEIDAAGTSAAKENAAAAIALSVWEIVYESAASGYSMSNGDFTSWGDFDGRGISALANGYLGKVESGQWSGTVANVRSLISVDGKSQNQIYYVGGAVPEPSTWALTIAGIGFVGGALRRRRTRPLATA